MKLDFFSTITIIGIIHGSVLSIIILKSRVNFKANRWLTLLILVFVFSGIYYLLIPTELYKIIPHYIGLHFPLMFLIGPLCYFYTKTLAGTLTNRKRFHVIPFVLMFILLIPFIVKSSEYKISYLLSYKSGQGSLPGSILYFLSLLHVVIYLVFSFKALIVYRKKLKENFSNTGKINLNWLLFLLVSASVIFALFIVLNILSFNGISSEVMDRTDIIILFIWIFTFGYLSKFQNKIPGVDNLPKTKSSIENSKSLYIDLLSFIKEKELFLDSNLTLPILAEKSGFTRNELSQIINENSGGNFYSLINSLRIEKSMELLSDTECSDMTILDIAYEVGFNTKATFNSAFKRICSCTPTVYRENSKNR